MAHKNQIGLERELNQAAEMVKVGEIYSHYKNPQNHYQVIGLGVQEATDKICVIYQAQYGGKFIFVRDLDSWLDTVDVDGVKVLRFKLTKD